MSDTSTQTGAPASSAAESNGQEAVPASSAAESAVRASSAAESSETTAQPETFSREYVEELRRENAKHRTAAKDFEDAFQGYDPDSRSALLDITRQLADPSTQPAAAKRLQAIAAKILEGEKAGTPTRPDGEEDPDQRPMTRAEWKAEQASAQETSARDAAIKDIEDTATKLGAPPGSPDYALLLLFAQDPDVAGDLEKANTKLQDHYRSKARAEAEAHAAKGERWPGVPGTAAGTGAADIEGGPEQIKTFKDARKAALSYLSSRAGAAS